MLLLVGCCLLCVGHCSLFVGSLVGVSCVLDIDWCSACVC